LLSTDKEKAFPLRISLVDPPAPQEQVATASGYAAMYPDGFGFKQLNPINSPRTIAYLWYLDKMIGAIRTNTIPVSEATESNKLTWQNFVTSFTYPMPRIFPSSEPSNLSKPNCDPPVQESVKSCNTVEDTVKNVAKTYSDVIRETKCLSNSFDKLLAAEERKKVVDIVGDNIYVEVDHILARMGCNIDSIFNEVLNKYGLGNLIELILGCLPVDIIFDNPLESQLSCLEKSLPGLYEAAHAAKGLVSGTGTFEEKKAILDFILEADPKGALDCVKIGLPDISLPDAPDISLPDVPDISLPQICFPSLPTISFPDLSLPDPMAFAMPQIEAILEEMLIEMFCSITTDLLKGIDCDDVAEAFDAAKGLANDVMNAAIKALLDKLGLGADKDEIALFVAALAKGTTGRDMAACLEGNSSDSTKQQAKALLNWRFPGLKDDFGNDAQIDDNFRMLGGFLGKDVIEATRTGGASPPGPSISGLLCDNDGKFEVAYSGALSDRLNGDRAQEQADGARARQRALKKKLDDLSDGINSILPNALRNLDDAAKGGPGPSAFSPGCPNSIIPKMPALDKMTNDVLDAIYSPTKMAFSEDARGFLSTIITKDIRALEEGDPGYTTEDDAKTYDWNEERRHKENADKTKTILKIAPYLKRNLQRGKSFWSWDEGSRMRIAFQASALEILTIPPESGEIANAKQTVKNNENLLEALMDALADSDLRDKKSFDSEEDKGRFDTGYKVGSIGQPADATKKWHAYLAGYEQGKLQIPVVHRKGKLLEARDALGKLEKAALEKTVDLGGNGSAVPPKTKFYDQKPSPLIL